MKEILGIVLIYVAAITLGLGLDILVVGLIYKIICWAFGLTFSWKITIGISFLILLLQSIFRTNVSIKK